LLTDFSEGGGARHIGTGGLLPTAEVATIAGGAPLPDHCPREFADAVLAFVDALP